MRPVCEQRPFDGLLKAARAPIDRERPAVAKGVKALRAAVAAFLAAQAPKVAAQLAELLGLEKAKRKPGGDEEALAAAAARARAALDALEFDDWADMAELIEPTLEAMARDGAAQALAQIGATSEDVRTIAGDRAAAWARARAAEMVGMRRTADGGLVPNPDAKWRIDDSTREMLRGTVEAAMKEGSSADELAARIQDAHAFSDTRAEAIARTEMAKADVAGAMEGYRASGLVAGKFWSTAQDDLVSDECVACGEAGVIPIDDVFPSGEEAPPNHPNCRCTVLPVLTDEMPAAGKNLKDTNMTKLWADISKSEKQDDGTIKVWGFASSEVVDSDGETITADAMRGARDGYMAFANVREMHDPKKAAGVAIEYEVQEDGRTWFGAHVVDPVAVLKVETGVYKGFSIGAKVPPGGRDGKIIKAIDLREVSLVDRPANPEATFTMFKADDAAADAPPSPLDALRKYAGEEVWDVATALGALDAIMGLLAREASEPNDPPEQVEALRAAVAGIKRFIASEITEDNTATITMSAAGGDLQKAGARFSKSTKDALKAAHDACKAADKALADLGYEGEDEAAEEGLGGEGEAGKADAAADLQKRAAEAEAEQVTEIAKAAGLDLAAPTAQLLAAAAVAELLDLRKAHDALKASPAAPKGYRNAAGTLAKSEDREGQNVHEPAPVVKADGAVDDVATLVKAAQARPIRLN
jgi:SPP1 gp7 family putative phage head morphogenesis protein